MSLFTNVFSRTVLRPLTKLAEPRPTSQFLWTVTNNWMGNTGAIGSRHYNSVSGVKKRFRLRGSGSVKRSRAGKSHNTGYKTRKRVNHLGSTAGITGKKMNDRIRKLLGCF